MSKDRASVGVQSKDEQIKRLIRHILKNIPPQFMGDGATFPPEISYPEILGSKSRRVVIRAKKCACVYALQYTYEELISSGRLSSCQEHLKEPAVLEPKKSKKSGTHMMRVVRTKAGVDQVEGKKVFLPIGLVGVVESVLDDHTIEVTWSNAFVSAGVVTEVKSKCSIDDVRYETCVVVGPF